MNFGKTDYPKTWYRQKNKYRGIGEVQAPDKCSAQQEYNREKALNGVLFDS